MLPIINDNSLLVLVDEKHSKILCALVNDCSCTLIRVPLLATKLQNIVMT